MSRVFLGSVRDGLAGPIRSGMEFVNWIDSIKPDSRVAIKPNFTFPFYKPGVTTSPAAIETLVSLLREVTPNIVIVESDGGSNAWRAEEAFAGHDLDRICRTYDVKVENLSLGHREHVSFPLRSGEFSLPMPALLLQETDVFITMPVPKIHCMTVVSLALKNQWGCLPEATRRFVYHSRFNELIVHVNRLLKTRFIVADCSHMITGNGPMFGELVETDLLVVSDDVGAFELTMLEIMGFDNRRIGHIEEAKRQGIVPSWPDGVEFNADRTTWKSDKFFLKRTIQNYVALAGFHSRFITWLGYESPLAGPLHTVLYALKGGNPLRDAIDERERAVQP